MRNGVKHQGYLEDEFLNNLRLIDELSEASKVEFFLSMLPDDNMKQFVIKSLDIFASYGVKRTDALRILKELGELI